MDISELKRGDMVYYSHFLGKLGISEVLHLAVRTIYGTGEIVLTSKTFNPYLDSKTATERLFYNKKECEEKLKELKDEYKKSHKNEKIYDYDELESETEE